MFDPIQAPDVHRGPATGHSTEFGTTWQEAVTRINGAFKVLFERGEAGAYTMTDEFAAAVGRRFEAAEAHVAFLEEALSAALFKIDSHEAKITALSIPAEPAPTPPIPDVASTDPVLPAEPAA